MAFSLQENYTDWLTTTGRRIFVPTFVYRGASCGQHSGTAKAINISFLDRSC
jgi:hypothetical protein